VTLTGNAGCFKLFYNGIPNDAVWRVLREKLHLKAYEYKMSIIQYLGRYKKVFPNTRHTVIFEMPL
jgi:hypothetical protein